MKPYKLFLFTLFLTLAVLLFGRQIGKWVQKAAESDCTTVMLLPARTDTKWFHDYIYGKAEIRFVKGRIKFGDSKQGAPFPSMVVVFRNSKKEKQYAKQTNERACSL